MQYADVCKQTTHYILGGFLMSKECKREFKVKETVYLVDYWGMEASKAKAKILEVDEKNKTFDVVLYGDVYQRYKFEDHGRLVFDTPEEAEEAVNKLPKPDSVVYQRIGQSVYKKKVVGITGYYFDDGYDLTIVFENEEKVSVKEIGVSIFLNEEDASRYRK